MVSSSQLCFAIHWVENWSKTGQALRVEKRRLHLLLDVCQAPGPNTCQLQPTFRRPDQGARKLIPMARKSKGEGAAVHE